MDRDRLDATNIRTILEAWFDKNPIDALPWLIDPKRVEVGVSATLFNSSKGTIVFCGQLDLLATMREDGETLTPVDHKTTGQLNARFVNQYTMDSQQSGYDWLASQLTGTPIRVSYINAIELSLLPNSDRKCAKHGVPYFECSPEHMNAQVIGPIERTEHQIEEWQDEAIGLAIKYRRLLANYDLESLHDVPKEGTFNGSCSYCEFREFCNIDRPIKQVPRMFVQSKWEPHKRIHTRKPRPNEFWVDNSTLKSAASCSTQALMRYGWGYTNAEQTGPLGAGTAVHKSLETYFKGGTVEEALAAFDETYQQEEAA